MRKWGLHLAICFRASFTMSPVCSGRRVKREARDKMTRVMHLSIGAKRWLKELRVYYAVCFVGEMQPALGSAVPCGHGGLHRWHRVGKMLCDVSDLCRRKQPLRTPMG